MLQAVAGIRPGSKATASWGVIRHQKVRVFAGLYSMKEMWLQSAAAAKTTYHRHKTALCDAQAHHPASERTRRSGRIRACGNRKARWEATEGTLSEMRTESKMAPIFCGQADLSRHPAIRRT